MQNDPTADLAQQKANAFGERLRALRTKEGLTQPDLATLLKVKRQTIASWEQGSTAPDLKTLFLLKGRFRQEYGSEVDLPDLIGEKLPGDGGAPIEVIIRLLQRIAAMGVEDIHPTRAEALSAFCPFLEREQKSIGVVSSSFLGVTRVAPARIGEVLRRKAEELKKDFKVLLTHPTLSNSRENQERRTEGSIRKEIEESVKTLEGWGVPPESIRFYKGTPTIFLMFTPTRMLANPYTYEAEAFKTVTFELSAAKPNSSRGGIYEQYLEHHFKSPWERCESLKDLSPEWFSLKSTPPSSHPSSPRKRV